MTELTRDEIARVCRYCGNDPEGGRLHKAQAYEDATGEPRMVAIRKAEEALQTPRAPAPLTRTELAEEPRLTPLPADPEPSASTEAKPPEPDVALPADLVEAMQTEVLDAFCETIG